MRDSCVQSGAASEQQHRALWPLFLRAHSPFRAAACVARSSATTPRSIPPGSPASSFFAPMPLFDPAAAEHQIAIVKYGSLARSYGTLRLIEMHLDEIGAIGRNERRGRRRVFVPNLYLSANRFHWGRDRDPVYFSGN